MKSKRVFVALVMCAAFAQAAAAQKTKPELFGVRLGMTETEARARLNQVGRWEEEKEQRRDSVWLLKGDKRFSHVAVGFDKETRRVRYVTAFARAGGERVRPADVIDLKLAQRVMDPAGNYSLRQEVRGHRSRPGYVVIAFGRDPEALIRLSVKLSTRVGDEDENDK
jgi:hypothetical protein